MARVANARTPFVKRPEFQTETADPKARALQAILGDLLES